MNLLLNLYDYLTGKKAMRFYCFDQLGNHVLSIMVFPANACSCYGKRHCSVKKQASRVECMLAAVICTQLPTVCGERRSKTVSCINYVKFMSL